MTDGTERVENGQPKKSSSMAIWLVVIALIVVGGLAYWGVKRRAAKAGPPGGRMAQPVVPVTVGTVQQKDVPIYVDGLGTVQAFNTVLVRARVDGQLKKIAFVEGQDVHKGDLLAQIDPDPLQTALDEAIAKKGQDEAQLINAQIGLKRETDLVAAKIDAQQVYDTQKALADQMDATVKADQAAIESAKVQLNYATIASPIDGRTGIRQVDEGNIIHATDSNGVVVITQLKPISVTFPLREQDLDAVHQEMAQNTNGLTVLAVGENDEVVDTGKLAVVDNKIDTTSATVLLKATFPNEKLRLWPGQFVNARLLLKVQTNGLVVPTPAIQRGPTGAYVFVIAGPGGGGKPGGGKGGDGKARGDARPTDKARTDVTPTADSGGGDTKVANDPPDADATNQRAKPPEGGTPNKGGGTNRMGGAAAGQPTFAVKMRPVTVSSEVNGAESLVTSGLQKGERIVVDGQYKLQDGSLVRIAQSGSRTNASAGPPDSIQ